MKSLSDCDQLIGVGSYVVGDSHLLVSNDLAYHRLIRGFGRFGELPEAFPSQDSSSNFMPLVVKILLDSGLIEDSFILR
jgi:hypothetical protein